MDEFSRDIKLERRIDAYVKGHLDEEQAQNLWEDLLKRPDYIELLETELGVKFILQGQKASSQTKKAVTSPNTFIHRFRNYGKWAAAAAVVIIMIISVNLFRVDSNQAIRNIAIDEINLLGNLLTIPVTRSEDYQLTPADSLLNLGFKAAIDGNVDKALRLYGEVITRYGDGSAAVRAHMNIAMIHYNLRYYNEAIDSFKKVLQKVSKQAIIKEKAYWYLGNAYIIKGNLALARENIQKAYEMNGILKMPALHTLDRLDEQIAEAES